MEDYTSPATGTAGPGADSHHGRPRLFGIIMVVDEI